MGTIATVKLLITWPNYGYFDVDSNLKKRTQPTHSLRLVYLVYKKRILYKINVKNISYFNILVSNLVCFYFCLLAKNHESFRIECRFLIAIKLPEMLTLSLVGYLALAAVFVTTQSSDDEEKYEEQRDSDDKLCAVQDRIAVDCIRHVHEHEFESPKEKWSQKKTNSYICDIFEHVGLIVWTSCCSFQAALAFSRYKIIAWATSVRRTACRLNLSSCKSFPEAPSVRLFAKTSSFTQGQVLGGSRPKSHSKSR